MAHPSEWLPVAQELADALKAYREMGDVEWVRLPPGSLTRPRWVAARQAVQDFGANWPFEVRTAARSVGVFLDLDESNVRCNIPHDHDPRGFFEAKDAESLAALETAIRTAHGEQPLFPMENIA